MKLFENQSFDQERALYGETDIKLLNCRIDGPADGESAFKEGANVVTEKCFFNLRYPFWHVKGANISGCQMTELCRAAIWYSNNVNISGTDMHGIKALRECSDVTISDCDIISPEFGWSVKKIKMSNSSAVSEYFMMRSESLHFNNVKLKGKYSFQYITNSLFEDCDFDTKDAFWHSENVTVKNSLVKGEYLAWYSHNLTLENCTIIGTQPFCYCTGLRLINCGMIDTDLSFEKSEVEAEVTTPVLSIKNPTSGRIKAVAVNEIIRDDPQSKAEIIIAC